MFVCQLALELSLHAIKLRMSIVEERKHVMWLMNPERTNGYFDRFWTAISILTRIFGFEGCTFLLATQITFLFPSTKCLDERLELFLVCLSFVTRNCIELQASWIALLKLQSSGPLASSSPSWVVIVHASSYSSPWMDCRPRLPSRHLMIGTSHSVNNNVYHEQDETTLFIVD